MLSASPLNVADDNIPKNKHESEGLRMGGLPWNARAKSLVLKWAVEKMSIMQMGGSANRQLSSIFSGNFFFYI